MNLFSISIDSLYTFQNQLVDFYKGSCWDFDMNCVESINLAIIKYIYLYLFRSSLISLFGVLPGARVRNSARGKGHEEGSAAYAKAGSSLRSPPGNSRASTPKTRVCLLYCFVLSPTPLTLWVAVPHHLFRRRS